MDIFRIIKKQSWLSAFLMVSCVTGQVELRTEPGKADVWLKTNFERSSLGKTPLTLTPGQLSRINGEIVQIEITKDGYFGKVIVIPKITIQKAISISVDLDKIDDWMKTQEEYKSCTQMGDNVTDYLANIATKTVCPQIDKLQFSKLARNIAETQSFIMRKEYKSALERLNVLVSDYPNISVIYDLLGNIAFLQKNPGEALKQYQKSLQLEPNNPQTQRMVDRIKQLNPQLTDKGDS